MTDKQKDNLFKALGSRAYDRALAFANSVVGAPRRLTSLIQKAQRKAVDRLKQAGQVAFGETNTSLRLLQAYAEGRYKGIAAENVVLLVAALAYFLAPIDAIPDFFFALGITDDIALLTWTFNKLNDELKRFKVWEAQAQKGDQNSVIDVTDYKSND